MNELIDRPQFDQLNLCLRNNNNTDRKKIILKQFYYVIISGIKNMMCVNLCILPQAIQFLCYFTFIVGVKCFSKKYIFLV